VLQRKLRSPIESLFYIHYIDVSNCILALVHSHNKQVPAGTPDAEIEFARRVKDNSVHVDSTEIAKFIKEVEEKCIFIPIDLSRDNYHRFATSGRRGRK
jgi:hypothetical protein